MVTMVCRELRWRRRRGYCEGWTAIAYRVDLSFTLEPGRRGGYVNRNAVLIVRAKKPGAKVATEIILEKEFTNSYVAKNVIDALLFICWSMKTNEEAYEWFMTQLKDYPGAPTPEYPKPGSHIYYPQGYEY